MTSSPLRVEDLTYRIEYFSDHTTIFQKIDDKWECIFNIPEKVAQVVAVDMINGVSALKRNASGFRFYEAKNIRCETRPSEPEVIPEPPPSFIVGVEIAMTYDPNSGVSLEEFDQLLRVNGMSMAPMFGGGGFTVLLPPLPTSCGTVQGNAFQVFNRWFFVCNNKLRELRFKYTSVNPMGRYTAFATNLRDGYFQQLINQIAESSIVQGTSDLDVQRASFDGEGIYLVLTSGSTMRVPVAQ